MIRQFTMGLCAESYEMVIGVVIFLLILILVCFLVFCSLPSQLSRNVFWWIWLICTRRPRTAGSIPAQEDERAMIRDTMMYPGIPEEIWWVISDLDCDWRFTPSWQLLKDKFYQRMHKGNVKPYGVHISLTKERFYVSTNRSYFQYWQNRLWAWQYVTVLNLIETAKMTYCKLY